MVRPGVEDCHAPEQAQVAWRKDAMFRQVLSTTLVAAPKFATSTGVRLEIGGGGAFA